MKREWAFGLSFEVGLAGRKPGGRAEALPHMPII